MCLTIILIISGSSIVNEFKTGENVNLMKIGSAISHAEGH